MIFVNGNSKSKEILVSNLIDPEKIEYVNANEVISELAEDQQIKDERRHEKMIEILTVENDKNKLIRFAKLAGYSNEEIASHFRLSIRQVIRIK
jgi:hypothetical protein